ncbi:hypothetical protein LTR53_004658, partial [Teratosphaeriaceae sp. CCFEE 6253]
ISRAVPLKAGLTLAAISAPGVPGAVVIDGNTLYADGAERFVDGYTISGVVGRVIVLGTTVAKCAIASAEEPLTAAGVTVVQEHIEVTATPTPSSRDALAIGSQTPGVGGSSATLWRIWGDHGPSGLTLVSTSTSADSGSGSAADGISTDLVLTINRSLVTAFRQPTARHRSTDPLKV